MPAGVRAIAAVFAFVLGCVFASFGGVVIDRLPRKESIVSPGSHCDRCGRALRWYENIPLVSWLIQRGKCRGCGAKIGAFSFVYELLGGGGFLIAFLRFGFTADTLFAFAVLWLISVMAGIDYKNHFAYDGMQIAYLVLAAGYAVYACCVRGGRWYEFLIGGAVGFVFFLLIKLLGRVFTGRECLGFGDVLFMGVSGCLLGWKGLLLCVLVSSVVGSVVELTRERLLQKGAEKRGESSRSGAEGAEKEGGLHAAPCGSEPEGDAGECREIAFIPYLALGVAVALLFGDLVIGWYLGVLA